MLSVSSVQTLFIDGCPMYGCRSAGSFSFYSQVPKSTPSVKWITDFHMDPVPYPLGCVSNSANIVCQSSGVFEDEQGYISLRQNGTLSWRDKLLHFPLLPILDNYGDVTGSDGTKLVHYDQNGKAYPAIPCQGLRPLFNMGLVGDDFLLLVSENGNIVVRQTNGVPVGSISINTTVDGVNGTFVPVAQPVVNSNANRFYLLTVFIPQNFEEDLAYLDQSEMRVYAVDVYRSISNRIAIAWHYTVANNVETDLYSTLKHIKTTELSLLSAPLNLQALLFDRVNQLIYVNVRNTTVTNSGGLKSRENGMLLALNNSGTLVFKRKDIAPQLMTKFVTDHCHKTPVTQTFIKPHCGEEHLTDSLLWILNNGHIVEGFTADGKSVKNYNLSLMFDASVMVTSQLSTVRNADSDNDTLVFAVVLSKQTSLNVLLNVGTKGHAASFGYEASGLTQASFVVAIDTRKDESDKDAILWTVPVPNNMRILGQISGASGTDLSAPDQLIAYAELPSKSGVIIGMH